MCVCVYIYIYHIVFTNPPPLVFPCQDNDESKHYGAAAEATGAPPMPGEVPAHGSASSLYPSMNPNAMGARPDLK